MSNEAWQRSLSVTPSQSLVGQAANLGADVAVTSICAAAGAIGGASAGEVLGGDLAISAIGPIAEPLGQAVGRNVGRVVGGTLGAIVPPALATSIRCPSRIRSSRSPSTVRFAPDIPFQQQHSLRNVQSGEIRQTAVENTNDLIVALRREQQDGLSATQLSLIHI